MVPLAHRFLLWTLPELRKTVDELVEDAGRSRDFYLCEIIERGVGETEDYYLASASADRIRQGVEPTHSDEEIRADLGLDDNVRSRI
ncbi:MAG: CopG family transcriptional regulator [Caldilineaceae bacterium SB0670_bin_27]|uniref:CopG family transcriptional regulator n=1 Tax=Caldilineaceae bacterium SB0664_bin_27 TaxID=2605260 RepID=A0A6B0YSR4_9CHLR|nr:CopG family transcriptional regulator [Caldilineaceae bacterium SB0664_bin_27]MYJ77607.1 CopG family transcriptional regulator [Caldilineaceae bacterium SB0670_bin_27]